MRNKYLNCCLFSADEVALNVVSFWSSLCIGGPQRGVVVVVYTLRVDTASVLFAGTLVYGNKSVEQRISYTIFIEGVTL